MWLRAFIWLTFLSAAAFGQENQGGQEGAPQAQAPGDMITQWLFMMVMIFLVFYFLVIRPQQKQRKEHEAKINALKKGDRILTTGGLYGNIVGIKDTVAVVKIAENVKVEIAKSAISGVLEKDEKVE